MAISRASYSVGNRVYNGGSSAPTRGTVDPMGYVDRELNKPSQARSGLASAALRRLSVPSVGASPGTVGYGQTTNKTPTAGTKPYAGPSMVKAPIAAPAPLMSKPGTSSTGRLTMPKVPTVVPPGLPATTPPGLPVGQTAATGGTSFGYDPDAADMQIDLAAQNNKVNFDLDRSQRDFEREIMLAERELQQAQPGDERNLLEDYGSRGLIYSSGYGNDQSELQSNYAKMFSELGQGKAQGLEDLLRQRGLWNETYQGRLSAIQQAAARRAAEQAGSLGLASGGTTDPGGSSGVPVPVGGSTGMPTAPALSDSGAFNNLSAILNPYGNSISPLAGPVTGPTPQEQYLQQLVQQGANPYVDAGGALLGMPGARPTRSKPQDWNTAVTTPDLGTGPSVVPNNPMQVNAPVQTPMGPVPQVALGTPGTVQFGANNANTPGFSTPTAGTMPAEVRAALAAAAARKVGSNPPTSRKRMF